MFASQAQAVGYHGDEFRIGGLALYVTDGISIAGQMFTIEMLNSNKDILPSSFIIPESLRNA